MLILRLQLHAIDCRARLMIEQLMPKLTDNVLKRYRKYSQGTKKTCNKEAKMAACCSLHSAPAECKPARNALRRDTYRQSGRLVSSITTKPQHIRCQLRVAVVNWHNLANVVNNYVVGDSHCTSAVIGPCPALLTV